MDQLGGEPDRTDEAEYEARHVHEVYDKIADHFSHTRYKGWPAVVRFLQSVPDGSVGFDVGCGNGKYLASVGENTVLIGSDYSDNLCRIANGRNRPGGDVVRADVLNLPHPDGSADFVISIAVIHHLSSIERRVDGIKSLLNLLRSSQSRLMIVVWAKEQDINSRRRLMGKDGQDVMVPWVLNRKTDVGDTETLLRYYHLYTDGELDRDVRDAGGVVVESGYEKDNWWVIARVDSNT